MDGRSPARPGPGEPAAGVIRALKSSGRGSQPVLVDFLRRQRGRGAVATAATHAVNREPRAAAPLPDFGLLQELDAGQRGRPRPSSSRFSLTRSSLGSATFRRPLDGLTTHHFQSRPSRKENPRLLNRSLAQACTENEVCVSFSLNIFSAGI